ncbi:MAG: hypothetical protein QXK67_05060 [Pyrobaculum sp.]
MDVVVKKVARKSVGLYYTLWATFPPVLTLVFSIVGGGWAALVVFFILMAIYMAYTVKILIEISKIKRERISLTWVFYPAAIFIVLAVAFIVSGNVWRISFLAAGLLITSGVYWYLKASGAGARWFDHLALLPIPIIFATAPEYYGLWSVMTITWLYAGVKSLVGLLEE